jgi:hypothetical protein
VREERETDTHIRTHESHRSYATYPRDSCMYATFSHVPPLPGRSRHLHSEKSST